MKNVQNMQDALAYEVQRLMYTELRIKETFGAFTCHDLSMPLMEELNHYEQRTEDKISKLERIFNYLMLLDVSRKDDAANALLAEMKCTVEENPNVLLRDILIIGCMQKITAYKTAAYQSASMLAAELELDTVAELLEQILKWEMKSSRILSAIAIEAFNKVQQSSTK
jgi:ferritin-like metal-binding protein YciE